MTGRVTGGWRRIFYRCDGMPFDPSAGWLSWRLPARSEEIAARMRAYEICAMFHADLADAAAPELRAVHHSALRIAPLSSFLARSLSVSLPFAEPDKLLMTRSAMKSSPRVQPQRAKSLTNPRPLYNSSMLMSSCITAPATVRRQAVGTTGTMTARMPRQMRRGSSL